VPFGKRWPSPGSPFSPNQTEPSGATVIAFGLVSGDGRLNSVTPSNVGPVSFSSFAGTIGAHELALVVV